VPSRPRSEGAHTLPELLLVVLVLSAMAVAAIPRFSLAVEQARVDQAAATLHAIWVAQRLQLLETDSFADDLVTLSDAGYIAAAIDTASTPFDFSIGDADADGFLAQAVRSGSTTWTGTLMIDETGTLSGSTDDGDDHVATPTDIE